MDRRSIAFSGRINTFWPNDGISAVVSARGRLTTISIVIGQAVSLVTNDNGPATDLEFLSSMMSILSFEEYFSGIFVINNAQESPQRWKMAAAPLTVQNSTTIRAPRSNKMEWYKWIAIASADGLPYVTGEDSFVYLLGQYHNADADASSSNSFDISSSNEKSCVVVARIRIRDLLKLSTEKLEVLQDTVDVNEIVWGPAMESRPRALLHMNVPELSLHFDSTLNVWIIVGFDSILMRYSVCSSRMIQGPWTCSQLPWSSIDVNGGPANKWTDQSMYLTYAGKAHAELSASYRPFVYNVTGTCQLNKGSQDVVMSFVPNWLNGPSGLLHRENYDIYVPKFVSASLKN